MKNLIILTLFVFCSCNNPVSVNMNRGDIHKADSSWLITSGKTEYYPVNLPDEFKVNGLIVDFEFNKNVLVKPKAELQRYTFIKLTFISEAK